MYSNKLCIKPWNSKWCWWSCAAFSVANRDWHSLRQGCAVKVFFVRCNSTKPLLWRHMQLTHRHTNTHPHTLYTDVTPCRCYLLNKPYVEQQGNRPHVPNQAMNCFSNIKRLSIPVCISCRWGTYPIYSSENGNIEKMYSHIVNVWSDHFLLSRSCILIHRRDIESM